MSTASKTLTFYTAVNDATKRLRSPAQIALTLSLAQPVIESKYEAPYEKHSMEPQSPIAWQVLQFPIPNIAQNVSVNYTDSVGITEVESEIHDVYKPGGAGRDVEIGKIAKFNGQMWSIGTLSDVGQPHDHFSIQNRSKIGKEIALGSYSPGDQDKQHPFISVVLLGSLEGGFQFHCTAPVLLQAYLTVNHTRGQRLLPEVVEETFLFKDAEGRPSPIKITNLKMAGPSLYDLILNLIFWDTEHCLSSLFSYQW
ncbi:hypothetical protein K438DRAFT_1153076 [Mycena galopus ATCC 62051]|nr:hypothetical protein K438DRAFT_1153076 [Mycena galopus ATCC 62051]